MKAALTHRAKTNDYVFSVRHTVIVQGKKKRHRKWFTELGVFESKTTKGVKTAQVQAEKKVKELSIRLQAEKINLIKRTDYARTNTTVGDWFTHCSSSHRGANDSRPTSALKWTLKVWGPSMKLTDIDKEQCRALASAMRSSRLSGSGPGLGKDTVANYLGIVQEWLDKALEQELITSNNMRSIKKPRANYVDASTKETLEPEHWRLIRASESKLTPAQLRHLDGCEFMACTGMYWCELIRVKWGDIVQGLDSEGVSCTQLEYYRRKNEGGTIVNRRINVILNNNALALLEKLTPGAPEELVFTQVGQTCNNASKHMKNICAIAGVDRHITSGAFRHMKGEQMNRDGASPWEIANQLGHSTLKHVQRYTKRARANSSRVAGDIY